MSYLPLGESRARGALSLRLGHKHQDGPMVHRMKHLVMSGYIRFANEVEKRLRMKGFWAAVFIVIIAILFYVWNLRVASKVTVTHDQARTYAGVLAQVIPVLLLALYVESTAAWKEIQAEQREERMRLLDVGRSIESAREKAVKARTHYADGTTSSELELADLTNIETMYRLQSMMVDHKKRSAREGTRAVLTVLQLFVGLIGEVIALSFSLAPRSQLMGASTSAVLLLLFLFGLRLVEWPRAVSQGRAVQLLSYVMGPVLLFALVAALARIGGIHVSG